MKPLNPVVYRAVQPAARLIDRLGFRLRLAHAKAEAFEYQPAIAADDGSIVDYENVLHGAEPGQWLQVFAASKDARTRTAMAASVPLNS